MSNFSRISPNFPLYLPVSVRFECTSALPTELWRNMCKQSRLLCVGISLFSHLVAKALSSAPLSLTSVFGMGTGGPSASSTLTIVNVHIERY